MIFTLKRSAIELRPVPLDGLGTTAETTSGNLDLCALKTSSEILIKLVARKIFIVLCTYMTC